MMVKILIIFRMTTDCMLFNLNFHLHVLLQLLLVERPQLSENTYDNGEGLLAADSFKYSFISVPLLN